MKKLLRFIFGVLVFFSLAFGAYYFLREWRENIDNHRASVDFMNFFEPGGPLLHIGSDDEIKKTGNYEILLTYCVDDEGNVYAEDKSNRRIDKFDNRGNYLFSFGGLSGESSQYPGWSSTIAVNSKGNVIAYSIARHKFLFFSKDGKEFKTIDFNNELKNWYIKKMKADKDDNLFLLGHSQNTGYQLVKYNLETKDYKVIHTYNKRIRPFFKDLRPDFDIDGAGNVYITDTIEYQVFKYSNHGQSMDRFFTKAKKTKMQDRDFHITIRRGKNQKIPNYQELWKKLKGPSGYFPSIFGIHIDQNRLYIWTANQDADKKYLVDVYDLSFKYLCTTAYYNVLGDNLAVIRNRRFYIPNIGSDNMALKNVTGRFGLFNIPYKIDIFRISGKVLMD